MLTGQYPITEIVKIANSWGLTTRPTKRRAAHPLCKSTVYKMFTKQFYTGKFVWAGETYEGNYPPMITMEEFDRVQGLLGLKYVPRPQKFESFTSGLIRCSCGGCLIVEHVKKFIQSKGKHVYYAYARCGRQKKGHKDCKELAIPVHEIEKQASEYLSTIRISDAFHKWAIKNIQQVQEQEKNVRFVEVDSLRKAHDDCQRKLDNLLDLKISSGNTNGSLLSDDEFKTRKLLLMGERDRLLENMKQANLRADKWGEIVQDAFDTAVNAQREFDETKEVQKKKLILSKIGANFFIKNGNLNIEAKQPYLTFEKRLPEVREIEERGKPPRGGSTKPHNYVLREVIPIWSGTRESNPCLRLGKAAYYHCTSTADFQIIRFRERAWRFAACVALGI